MENKQTLYYVLTLAIGFILAYLIFGTNNTAQPQTMQHMMPDGTMMHGDTMSMEDMMHDMNAQLLGKTGDAFDQAFLEEMIVHHQGAVEMAELVLATSKRSELITLANDIIAAQTREIAMMQGWLDTWFTE